MTRLPLPPLFECLAQHAGIARRSARQGHDGRWWLHEAGAAPSPPCGAAPRPASAAVTLLSRSGKLPTARTVVATALATLLSAVPAWAGPMEDRAQAAAEAARAKSASSEALQQNYLTPGLAGQPIMTVDSSKSFSPNIACQKTATLLELLVQPAPSGDLGAVKVSRDLDLDGSIDTVNNLPVAVSGICANGVIACDPGSWSQCHYYLWGADAARNLTLSEVAMPSLAGCYCLNNSCGTNLAWSNMASVLTDLGGGMIGALTTADPRIGVARAVIDGPTIRYVGAQATACVADPALPQTGYRAMPAALPSDAIAAASNNSIFQALSGSAVGMGKMVETSACTVTRQVDVEGATIDDVITRVSGGYATIKGAGSVAFQLGSPRDDALAGGSCRLFDFKMALNVVRPDRLVSAILSQIFFDDWIQIRVDGALVYSNPAWSSAGFPPGGCERGRTWFDTPGIDLKPYLTAGDHEIWLRLAVGGNGEASATIQAQVDESCVTSETIVDACGAYAGNPACTIRSEQVDGVQTFLNGLKTGLTPLPQTRILGTAACPVQLTRDYFHKDRVYRCEVDTGLIPQPDTSRGAYIIDHSTETLLADRVRKADGSFTASTRDFAMPDRGSVPACEPICKTRAARASTGAAPSGIVAAQQNAPTGFDTFYHACNAANACPLGPGEEIISACACLDDFPEAVVMMQTVRLAGADLVCTQAVR
jgi:hypothetical protein